QACRARGISSEREGVGSFGRGIQSQPGATRRIRAGLQVYGRLIQLDLGADRQDALLDFDGAFLTVQEIDLRLGSAGFEPEGGIVVSPDTKTRSSGRNEQ